MDVILKSKIILEYTKRESRLGPSTLILNRIAVAMLVNQVVGILDTANISTNRSPVQPVWKLTQAHTSHAA